MVEPISGATAVDNTAQDLTSRGTESKRQNPLKNLYKQNIKLLNDERLVTFQNANIKDVELDDATIVYMCSTCYSPELLDIVYNKLRNNKNIRYIITLKDYPKFSNILPNSKKINIPCSWSNFTTCTIFSR